jgi:hypothetical protein
VVVTVGLTLVKPLAEVDVNVPGVIARLVAPVVVQFSVLLDPETIFAGLAVNELIVGFGLLVAFTVTVRVEVVEPVALVTVSV